jgi:hypothetical protein
MSSDDTQESVKRAEERIRRDSHLAFGCAFAVALVVVSGLLIYLLLG